MININTNHIISISKLLGNYNQITDTDVRYFIISISKLLGSYNMFFAYAVMVMIISISKLLGNYNEPDVRIVTDVLYQYLNC